MVHCILARCPHQPLRTFLRHWFHTESRSPWETHLGNSHLITQKGIEFFRLRSASLPFDAGINILGILSEYDHIHLLGMLHRRFHALVPTHRPLTDIEVKSLTQSNIERAYSSAHRSHQRTLYTYMIFLESLQSLVRQISSASLESLASRQHLFPNYPALRPIGFFHGSIYYSNHRGRHFRSHPVAFHQRYCLDFHINSFH